MRKLNDLEATHFAMMILAGVAVIDICGCFMPPDSDDDSLARAAQVWPRSAEVLKKLEWLSGGVPWQEMKDEDRIKLALKKQYAEMSYYLWTHNYADLAPADRMKADTCRTTLERKLAGTSGQQSLLDEFYDEMKKTYNLQRREMKVGNA